MVILKMVMNFGEKKKKNDKEKKPSGKAINAGLIIEGKKE